MKKLPKSIRHNHKTYEVRGTHLIRGETYAIVGRYGRSEKSVDHVLHVTGRNQYDDRIVHVLDDSKENRKQFDNLKRAAGKSLPFARIITHVRKAGKLYVVAEYQPGESLRLYFQKKREISPYKAVILNRQLVSQVANMIRTTHVHHGDISPENIIVTRDVTRLVLIDFGSSFRYADFNRDASGDGNKPIYTAPEVAKGAKANRISEQFSCGMILNEMLTKKIAYSGLGGSVGNNPAAENRQPRLKSMLEFPENVASPFPKHIWPEIDSFLKTALALDPRRRFSKLDDWQSAAKHLAWLAELKNQPTPSGSSATCCFS